MHGLLHGEVIPSFSSFMTCPLINLSLKFGLSSFVRPQTSINEEIPPTETHPNPNEEGNQAILNDQTGIFEEMNRKNLKDTEKDNQIDNVVNNLLEALGLMP